MKRRVLFADIAMNISILALFLVVISLVSISSRLIEVHKLNNGYYSTNRQAFSINKKISTYKDIKMIYLKCISGTILYKELTQFEDLRGVLVKGDIQEPPIIRGRFFTENDLYKEKYLAVIGNKQTDRVYKSNDCPYIDIGGHPYEVIGITGSKKGSSLLDYSIYVNLDSFSEVDNNAGLYHLDGIIEKNVKKSLALFEKDIRQIDLGSYGIINVFFGEIPGFLLLICICLAFISFCVFFSYYWFCSHRKLFDVMTVIGISQNKIFKEFVVLYFKTVLPALILVFIISAILFTKNVL